MAETRKEAAYRQWDERRENLLGYLNDYAEAALTKSSGGKYCCPICGSGTGKKGTGALTIYKDTNMWRCFSCGQGGNLFDIVEAVEGITDYKSKLEFLEGRYGRIAARQNHTNQPRKKAAEPEPEMLKDYTSLYQEAAAHLEETTYHRGISLDTLKRFKVGYVAAWKSEKAPESVRPTPRLIIPISKHGYIARLARDAQNNTEGQYKKQKEGKQGIFNVAALDRADRPIHVVEGEIDALSIIDVGGEAVGLGSTSMVRRFLDTLKQHKPRQPLIMWLDNDESGQKAAQKIEQGLKEQGLFPFYRRPPKAGSKEDPNDILQRNRKELQATVQENERAVLTIVPEEITQDAKEEAAQKQFEEDREKYIAQNRTSNYIESFIGGIAASVDTPFTPTGFPELDHLMGGGLYEGLYCIGAISSLGKTTLVMQIADQIARQGERDILVFSLEMARTELMARSISRLTAQITEANGVTPLKGYAVTVRGVTVGAWYKHYGEKKLQIINAAIDEYASYAEHIYIVEGMGDVGIEQVKEAVKKHVKLTGKVPIIVIDYLQILAPADPRATDKNNMDKAVLEAKRLSRDYKTPVICVSSYNRANYKASATMEAFKESGAIEYSSDVLIGLQLKGVGEKDFDVDIAKSRNPREIELVVLKNRSGQTGTKDSFVYYPAYNFFRECPGGGSYE